MSPSCFRASPLRRTALRPVLALLAVFALLAAAGCGPAQGPPGSRDPGAVTADGTLGTPLLLAGAERTVYARIRLATLPRAERPRGAVNVGLVIDTSGSMEGAPIEEARRAAVQMIDALKDGDRLSVIAFHTRTEVLLASSVLEADVRAEVKRQIAEIKAQGTTDMAGGLDAALAEVRSHFDPKGVNRIVLLGDGVPNNASTIEASARSAAGTGIAVTALGLGLDYDEVLMGKIAQLSGGRFKYIESADKLASFFQEEILRLDTVYGRHASAVLTPGPGVRIDAVVGLAEPPAAGPTYVPLGDIARGDHRDILVRMTVTPRKPGAPLELLDAVITFDDALEDAGKLERRVYFGAYTSDDEAKVVKATNSDVELSAARAEASATMILGLEAAKRGANVRARLLLTKGAEAARAQIKRTPSAELEEQATNMVVIAESTPEADVVSAAPAPAYDFEDDQLSGEMVSPESISIKSAPAPAPPSEAVMRHRKKAHQYAIDQLQ